VDRRERIECKNCKRYSGWLACGGYKAGDSSEGIINLWTVFAEEVEIAVDNLWSTGVYGGPSCLEGKSGIKLMEWRDGCARRFVRSKE